MYLNLKTNGLRVDQAQDEDRCKDMQLVCWTPAIVEWQQGPYVREEVIGYGW